MLSTSNGRRPNGRRLLLVNPSSQRLGWIRRFQLPPLALLQVAAATPPEWEVVLADETFEEMPDPRGFDLVGITSMTHQAARTYQIAEKVRGLGVPVVLGGIHPTVLPEESIRHADAVVVGEGEPIWPGLLEDLSAGRLARFYVAPEPQGDLLSIPPARREILDGKPYLTRQVLQVSRGCPYDCPFCTVTPYFGRRFRYRSADDVMGEIGSLRGDLMVFLDDNLLGDTSRARPFLERMVPLEKSWASQVTLGFAEDPQLLALVARSGCLGLFVGVEAVSGSGSRLPKRRSRHPQEDLVKRAQDAGILVEVSLIFGLDDQDEDVFEEAVRFVESCSPCGATFHILTPYPGTALFKQFKAEGRLMHTEWSRYNHSEVVFEPRLMTAQRLQAGWAQARKTVYSWPSILSRVASNPHHRFSNLAYNVLRRAPNVRLDGGLPSKKDPNPPPDN